MSADKVKGRFKAKRSEFCAALVEELISCVDLTGGEDVAVRVNLSTVGDMNDHDPIPTSHKDRIQCTVCKLEDNWIDACKMKEDYGSGSRQLRHLVVCELCGISAHSLRMPWHSRIFRLGPLKGMSCFHIAHTEN